MHVRDCDWCGKTYVVKDIAEMGGCCSRKCWEEYKRKDDNLTETQKIARYESGKRELEQLVKAREERERKERERKEAEKEQWDKYGCIVMPIAFVVVAAFLYWWCLHLGLF